MCVWLTHLQAAFYHLGPTVLFTNSTNLWKTQIILAIWCVLQQVRYAKGSIFIFLATMRFEQLDLRWHRTRSFEPWISLLGMGLPLFSKTSIKVGDEWNANGECGRNHTGISHSRREKSYSTFNWSYSNFNQKNQLAYKLFCYSISSNKFSIFNKINNIQTDPKYRFLLIISTIHNYQTSYLNKINK